MPALADLALRAGDLSAVEVDAEVVPVEALVLAVLAGGVARQRSGDRDLVLSGSLLQVGQGGAAAVDQVLGGSSPRRLRRVWMPGSARASFVVAGKVATSVVTLALSAVQVSVRWATNLFQQLVGPRRT
ncbi:hypothetical protein [Streptomyces sp. ISL-99]|uniref:hypothetical protein n=1 Tax=Streptomyces sp. ISL-99 TaxID=2819193 RepID=UPI0020353DD3|nr:hypothetical protein [Streptomyces sp. ISL-99]